MKSQYDADDLLGQMVMFWAYERPNLGKEPSPAIINHVGLNGRVDLTFFPKAGHNGGGRQTGIAVGCVPGDCEATREQLADSGSWLPRNVYFGMMREEKRRARIAEEAAAKEAAGKAAKEPANKPALPTSPPAASTEAKTDEAKKPGRLQPVA